MLLRIVSGTGVLEVTELNPWEKDVSDLDLVVESVGAADGTEDAIETSPLPPEGSRIRKGSLGSLDMSSSESDNELEMSSGSENDVDNRKGRRLVSNSKTKDSAIEASRAMAKADSIILRKAEKILANLISLHKNARLTAASASRVQ